MNIADIINNPTAHNSSELFALVPTDNDVAMRGLYVQFVTPASAISSNLPWLQVANPFDAVAAAHLEVDTTPAPNDTTPALNLAGLSLEVDEKRLGEEIRVGEPVTVNLAEALQPDERMILRFQALLPLTAPEGTTFPINLRFFVDSRLIGGCRYVLRVAPLSKTVVQVLDTLVGAVRDVAFGFESDAALDLAGNVKEIVLRERENESRGGCWGLIRKFFSPESRDWQTELRKLAEDFAVVAKSLEATTGNEPERQVVVQRFYELADRLLTSAGTASPNLFIEQVRDIADRIQEPAGRVARRSQRALYHSSSAGR